MQVTLRLNGEEVEGEAEFITREDGGTNMRFVRADGGSVLLFEKVVPLRMVHDFADAECEIFADAERATIVPFDQVEGGDDEA